MGTGLGRGKGGLCRSLNPSGEFYFFLLHLLTLTVYVVESGPKLHDMYSRPESSMGEDIARAHRRAGYSIMQRACPRCIDTKGSTEYTRLLVHPTRTLVGLSTLKVEADQSSAGGLSETGTRKLPVPFKTIGFLRKMGIADDQRREEEGLKALGDGQPHPLFLGNTNERLTRRGSNSRSTECIMAGLRPVFRTPPLHDSVFYLRTRERRNVDAE